MTAPLLSVSALSYSHDGRALLDDISFDLHHGQRVALIGRSGSGKSLLLKSLADLLPLEFDMTNRIMLNKDGKLTPLNNISPQTYRHKVALFHQMPHLTDGTVLDNLIKPFEFAYHKHTAFNHDWHVDKLITLGKDERFLSQSTHTLSGGEKQLVSFLRTLQFNPTIALFDEMTSALDQESADMLMQLVLKWHDDTKAMIWVTHTPSQSQTLQAQLWQMDNGKLIL